MDIAGALSSQRLAAYRRSDIDTDQDILERYCWNVSVSEALYLPLHFLEVSLRNHVHAVIEAGIGNSNWLVKSQILDPREVILVNRAMEALKYKDKKLSAGDIIAELNFGFWTSLFDVRYERVLWQRLIKNMFPSMPRRLRTRHTASARLNRIRKLRNRVFHYEPIWHWTDLEKQYQEILETIHWISPETAMLVRAKSQFPETLARRPQ